MSSAFFDVSAVSCVTTLTPGFSDAIRSPRRFELPPPDVRRAVDDLPVEVARVDGVEVDDAELADARRGEIHGGRRPEPAGADADHAPRLELALPVHPDFRHDEVPAVALDFLARQLRRLVHGRIRPARHRRDDADGVARLERRLLAIEMADVLVVDVHVHEAAQLAVVVVQVAAEIAVFADQRLEQLANGAAVDFHDILPVRERPERCRDQNPMGHINVLRVDPVLVLGLGLAFVSFVRSFRPPAARQRSRFRTEGTPRTPPASARSPREAPHASRWSRRRSCTRCR